MKITRLYLKNFAPIYTALDKSEIDLDLTDINKVINIIIGKMGSGKTVILGHLQPFSSFGTLDIRNQDSIILDRKDGDKIIDYIVDNNYYHIHHVYTWNRNSHVIKSYITKNDIEMNPNGNTGSFKFIIEQEFGIEQNFLRLLRLGPNVANVINMKSTERKSFIASLLQDSEVYILLHKKVTEEMKEVNSQLNLLSNKLHNLGVDKESQLEDEYEDNKEIIKNISDKINTLKEKRIKIESSIDHILGNLTKEEFINKYNYLLDQLKMLIISKENIEKVLSELSSLSSLEEINRNIGTTEGLIESLTNSVFELETKYNEVNLEVNRLNDITKILINEDYIIRLKDEYGILKSELDVIKNELRGFDCKYSSSYLTILVGDLNGINILIDEVSQYKSEVVKKLYNSDRSILKWAKTQSDILSYTKLKLQKNINNIKYAEKYEIVSKMFLPPFCPTKTCPYYKTHPYNIQRALVENINSDNSDLSVIINQIDVLDVKINLFIDYPYIYTKIQTLKELWNKSYPVIKHLKADTSRSLLDTLTNYQFSQWYDYDKLMSSIDLCKKRENHYELIERMEKIKFELSNIELNNDSDAISKLNIANIRKKEILEELIALSSKGNMLNDNLARYNKEYISISTKVEKEKELNDINIQINSIKSELGDMDKNISIIYDVEEKIIHLTAMQRESEANIAPIINRNDLLKSVINDIKYSKITHGDLIKQRTILKHITDAVSTKEGIPLYMVKLFLDDSKDILNELISDVFGDTIEILDFNINETEFKIPYSINGQVIDDIDKASQGQQSIISIALSFALVRQSMFKYNIMLLDEVDGPLYEKDRQKFINILNKQLTAIGAEQVFLITHNNTFNGYPLNVIMTTDEVVDKTPMNNIMHV